MAYIITSIGQGFKPSKTTFSCMDTFCPKISQKNIHNTDEISQRIEQAGKIKQQLDADIFERDKKISQSAEARKKI